ncbi:hypothetical protein ACN47E_004523 [Coniothyrium glycines]
MQKISRRSLAALVCPSAPFLAPRLLHVSRSCLQHATYATKTKAKTFSINPRARKDDRKTQEPRPEVPRLLKQFWQACDTRNVQQMMDIYPTVLEAGMLSMRDSHRLAQSLHAAIRNIRSDHSRSEVFPFVQQIIADLRKGTLEPQPHVFVHLLGIYKDCKRYEEGLALWQWLLEQDDRFVGQVTYGAAIELLAYGGLMTLPELENLYMDGLKRFPGVFAEYHLSPDAVVPDRTQLTVVTGVPTTLLQGILTARILARDWKRAYLALDTALRLFPTQTPSRFFELFMTERPISEAYTAYLLACRAGVRIGPSHVTALLKKIRAAMVASSSMADRMVLLRATANALYAYVEAGSPVESIHVGMLIHAFEQLLPEKLAGEDYDGDAADLRDTIVVAAHEAISGLIRAGMVPDSRLFAALISLAGKLRAPALLLTTIKDVETLNIVLSPIELRGAITSAGLVANQDLLEYLWDKVTHRAESESAQIPFEDWITFTKACRRAGHKEYFQQQLLKLSHAITSSVERQIVQQIDSPDLPPSSAVTYKFMTLSELSSAIEAFKAQMGDIEAVIMSGQPLNFTRSPFYMHLDPDHPKLGAYPALRTVYDEMTIDPHQPPPQSSANGGSVDPVLSSTGIPLDELRFQNWVNIHEMMIDAEEYEARFQEMLDIAIKSGKPLKGASELLRMRKVGADSLRWPGELKTRIKALRTPASTPQEAPAFRKVGSIIPAETMIPMAYNSNEDQWVKSRGIRQIRSTPREEAADRGLPHIARQSVKPSSEAALRGL